MVLIILDAGDTEIDNNDIVMRHCPHCDFICLISKTDIDSARAANKLVSISCHQCHKQFAIDGEQTKDRKNHEISEKSIKQNT